MQKVDYSAPTINAPMTPNACSPVSSTPWLPPPAAYVTSIPSCRLTSLSPESASKSLPRIEALRRLPRTDCSRARDTPCMFACSIVSTCRRHLRHCLRYPISACQRGRWLLSFKRGVLSRGGLWHSVTRLSLGTSTLGLAPWLDSGILGPNPP